MTRDTTGQLFTITEAARLLRVSVRTVQRRLDDETNQEYTPVNEHGKRWAKLSGEALRVALSGASHDSDSGTTGDSEGDTLEAEVLEADVSHDTFVASHDSVVFNTDATRDTARNAGGESTLAIPESNVLALLADVVTARLREERAEEKAQARPPVPTADKLVLSLSECQELTGFSRQTLRAAIDDGALKAQIIGRGWRVKRADLDRYIAKL